MSVVRRAGLLAVILAGWMMMHAQIAHAQQAPEQNPPAQQSAAPPPAAPPQQNNGPVFRSQTTLVTVPTEVTDSHGARIWALKADDFEIRDNGVLQKVQLDDSPVPPARAIAIVVQNNDDTYLLEDSLNESLVAFLNALPDGDIPITVLTAGTKVNVKLPFTGNREDVQDQVTHLSPDADAGGPKLLDGVFMAAQMLQEKYPDRNKIILLVSGAHDGDSAEKVMKVLSMDRAEKKAKDARWNSTHTSQEVLQYVEANNVVVDAIEFSRYGLGASDYWKDSDRSTISLNPISLLFHAGDWMRKDVPVHLAEATGGEVRSVARKKTVSTGALRIAGDFSALYELSFHPTDKTPGLHEIRVSTPGRSKLKVRNRAFYWANGPTDTAPPPPAAGQP
jgi:VWFA-related protein